MTHLVSVDRGNHLLTLREPVWGARPCPRSTRRRVPSASERPCWPHRPCSPRPAAPPAGPPRTPSGRPRSRPRRRSPSSHDAMTMPMAAASGSDQGAAAGVRLQSLVAQHSVLVADMMRARILKASRTSRRRPTPPWARTRRPWPRSSTTSSARRPAASSRRCGAATSATSTRTPMPWARRTRPRRKAARHDLEKAEVALGDFFAGASGGRLPRARRPAAVTTHIDHLLDQADAFAAHRYAPAGAGLRHGVRARLRDGRRAGVHAAAEVDRRPAPAAELGSCARA